MTDHFEHLFVFGRPAGGKSEFIDDMKRCEPTKRLESFFIAPFEVLDDYLFIKEVADYEDILEKLSVPRRMTIRTVDGIAVTDDIYWAFASEKLNAMITKNYLSNPEFYRDHALLIEFSRGIKHFGYRQSLCWLRPEILNKGAIIYIKVTYEESLRRNEARYQEKLKHSILAHKCPEQIMEKYYRYDDWLDITENKGLGLLNINGVNIPFVTMENEPESTDPKVLDNRYSNALSKLWELREVTANEAKQSPATS